MLVDGFHMRTKPWEHQLKALSYLYERDSAALYTKPGSGKSKVFIDLIMNRGFKRILIVAPKKPCKVWPGQFKIHSNIPSDRVVLLSEMELDKKCKFLKGLKAPVSGESPLVLICNYESVWRKPLDRLWFYKKVGVDCVICDESHRIKSPSSKCSWFLARIGRAVKHRYLLTGTPLAENPLDVYAQYRFLDPAIFGTSFDEFKAEYENIDPVLSARIGHTVRNKKKPYKNLKRLRKKMFSCAFYVKSTVKLPKTTRKVVKIPMPKSLEKLYKELSEEGALEYGEGFMTVNNVLAMTIRKQQVTSGYLPIEYDDGTKELKRISTYRRTFLYNFLKQFDEDDPIVIFAKFKKDLYSLRKVAERLGRGYSEVSGSEDTMEQWKAGETTILGVQYTSGSESIDLTRAHICIFYSLDHSLGKYDQARERVHRPGQVNPCVYYHFVAVMSTGRTVDQDILQCWKDKKNYVNAVMRGDFEK